MPLFLNGLGADESDSDDDDPDNIKEQAVAEYIASCNKTARRMVPTSSHDQDATDRKEVHGGQWIRHSE